MVQTIFRRSAFVFSQSQRSCSVQLKRVPYHRKSHDFHPPFAQEHVTEFITMSNRCEGKGQTRESFMVSRFFQTPFPIGEIPRPSYFQGLELQSPFAPVKLSCAARGSFFQVLISHEYSWKPVSSQFTYQCLANASLLSIIYFFKE